MARIAQFAEKTSDINKLHQDVRCGYKVFQLEGETILQLDTYGSAERQELGQMSQSIQLDEDAAEYLLRLIRRAFPGIAV